VVADNVHADLRQLSYGSITAKSYGRYDVNKVVKDAISYARMQANNQYYKKILGQKMNKEMGSSSIYLTEEQYRKVKIRKSFDLQCLRLIFI
jgi:gamma-glutamyltranspeptidase